MRDEMMPDITDFISLAKSEGPRQPAAEAPMHAPRAEQADPKAMPSTLTEKPARKASTRVKRTPELEVAFGVRIRAARIGAGLNQTQLGAAVGITFQQVQKYESGRDRVAASTLQGIATALNVHPGSFYGDTMPAPSGSIPDVKAAMRTAKRIQRVRDPGVVKHLMALADLLAEEDRDTAGPPVHETTGLL